MSILSCLVSIYGGVLCLRCNTAYLCLSKDKRPIYKLSTVEREGSLFGILLQREETSLITGPTFPVDTFKFVRFMAHSTNSGEKVLVL